MAIDTIVKSGRFASYRQEHGVDGLIDWMQEMELPWIFDESDRQPMGD